MISRPYQVSGVISRDMKTIDMASDWFVTNLGTVIDHTAIGPKLSVPLDFGTFIDDILNKTCNKTGFYRI